MVYLRLTLALFDVKLTGDIKDDQLFLDQSGQVVLGDFGTAWKLVDADGLELRLRSRDELLDRRAGVGPFKAPELRGRCRADDAPLLKEVYAKAEGFSIGMVMYYSLGCHYVGDVFDRLCGTHLAEERRAEQGQAPSRPADPHYGRAQPGWVYSTADLPDLPASTPEWLASVVRGLVKSDHCEAERRLTPKEAIMMLEVEGLALAWTKLEDAQKQAAQAKQQLVVLQQQAELDRHTPRAPAEAADALRLETLKFADMHKYDGWFSAEGTCGLKDLMISVEK